MNFRRNRHAHSDLPSPRHRRTVPRTARQPRLRSRALHQIRIPHPHARRRQALHVRLRSQGRRHRRPHLPDLLQRTGYSVAPYGIDQYRASLGPSELFAREKFIFVYQDMRGRYMSEGEYVVIRPHKPVKSGPRDTDESTDTYDTIDWLVKNVPGNTGKVGMYGISQPGFYATAGMIDAHPALVAVAPQAPVTDYYMGDDSYHNGAFMLAHRFTFLSGIPRARRAIPDSRAPAPPFHFGTPDGYDFYLEHGLARQRRREVLQAPAAALEPQRRPHHLRRSLAIARHLEIPEEHQARRHAGGRLVRHRRSAGSAAPARLHGEERPARRQHAGDGPVESRRLRARRWRPPGQRQLRFEDRRCTTASTSSCRSSCTT